MAAAERYLAIGASASRIFKDLQGGSFLSGGPAAHFLARAYHNPGARKAAVVTGLVQRAHCIAGKAFLLNDAHSSGVEFGPGVHAIKAGSPH